VLPWTCRRLADLGALAPYPETTRDNYDPSARERRQSDVRDGDVRSLRAMAEHRSRVIDEVGKQVGCLAVGARDGV
jgi:hypothetical protein